MDMEYVKALETENLYLREEIERLRKTIANMGLEGSNGPVLTREEYSRRAATLYRSTIKANPVSRANAEKFRNWVETSGLSYEEIADMCEVGEGTVRSWVSCNNLVNRKRLEMAGIKIEWSE